MLFVNVASYDDITSKLVNKIELDDFHLTSNFNREVNRSKDTYVMITGISDTNIGPRMFDPRPLSLWDNIRADENWSCVCIQDDIISGGSTLCESKVGINLLVSSWWDKYILLIKELSVN